MKRVDLFTNRAGLVLVSAVLVLLPLCLCAQETFHISLPVKHGDSYSYTGHGGFSQYSGREFHYNPGYPLLVYQYTDYDQYMNDEGHNWQEHDFQFAGDYQYLGDRVKVKVPASLNSAYTTREMTISYDGYMLMDRYYSTADLWREYYYYYNEQNLLTGYLVRERLSSNPPVMNYSKHEYLLDAQGRRLADNISASTDSLTWTENGTVDYVYTGEAIDRNEDFEKYWPYPPRDYGFPASNFMMLPYVCNNWVLESATRTVAGGEESAYSYTYYLSDYDYIIYGEQYLGRTYRWDNLGLLTSSYLSFDVHYSTYGYTWNSMYVDNEDLLATPIQPNLSVYPNPFNPSTTIRYSLTAPAEPILRVYNLKGQLLRSYQPGSQAEGEYCVEFDGKDEKGQSLPSGVYLLKISLLDMAISRRMTLMK